MWYHDSPPLTPAWVYCHTYCQNGIIKQVFGCSVSLCKTGSCTLDFICSPSSTEASAFRLLFCLAHRHIWSSTSPSCISAWKITPQALCVHALWLSQWKLESDIHAFVSSQPGSLNQAIKDIEALVDKEVDGSVQSIWLMAEWVHNIVFCCQSVLFI